MQQFIEGWNSACSNSIRREKAEIGKRYNIRFGKTEIYCDRCGAPIRNPDKHMCADLRLEGLVGEQTEKQEAIRQQQKEINNMLVDRIKSMGRAKVATLLELDVKIVSRWIDRRKIAFKYQDKILTL